MKIKRHKSLGKVRTYSPEMKSRSHNYVTEHSNAIHANSHAVSYCLVAHRCLWLKAHFAPEWWAAVMSDCKPDKLVRYMGVARSERWHPTDITRLGIQRDDLDRLKFDTTNIENMTMNFTVTGNVVNQGLIGIKGIGESAAAKFEGRGTFADIDDFIEQKGGKDKTVLERFIKLGAFRGMPGHENAKALWTYYQYKYCSGKNITKLRKDIRQKLLERDGWNNDTIEEERQRQIREYFKVYPNRRKIPGPIQNWKPEPSDSRENVMSLVDEDFTLSEILQFEKEYLGYYLHSPLDLYDVEGNCSIDDAKEVAAVGGVAKLEVVITSIQRAISRNDKEYARVIVSDGVQNALVFIWQNELAMQGSALSVDTGVVMIVEYDETRGTFSLMRGERIIKLLPKGWDK